MKIATCNVNGVNGRLPVLLRWLELAEPDIVCLQELKVPKDTFPDAAIANVRDRVLREIGYRTIEATDAQTAIPLLQAKGAIDLLVTDVALPGLNGRQLAEIARESRPGLRVLFITGYAQSATIRSGLSTKAWRC